MYTLDAIAVLLSVVGLAFVVILVMKLVTQDQLREAARRRDERVSRS